MWRKRLSAFFAGLNAAIAVELSKWLVSPAISVPAPVALMSSALIAAIAQRILEFLAFEFPLFFEYTRKLMIPISRIDGYWLEEICTGNDSCHFSYACIQYVDEEKYKYYGTSFTVNFNVRAQYEADEVHVTGDQSTAKMHYAFQAKLQTTDPGDSNSVTGYGFLNFYSDRSDEFNRGGGYFIDNTGVTVCERRVLLWRITQKEIQSCLGKKTLSNIDEIKQVVETKVKSLNLAQVQQLSQL